MTELLTEILILAAALSIDAFVTGFACGVSRIRIPAVSVLILSFLSGLTLAAALFAGGLIAPFFPEALTNDLSFLILFSLGAFKLFESARSRRSAAPAAPAKIAEAADKNGDRRLSPSEAVPLGAALSLDSIAAGIGAGIFPSGQLVTVLAAILMGIAAISGGALLGRCLFRRADSRLTWLSGALLILLAFLKLI